jgi:hypothetical protein
MRERYFDLHVKRQLLIDARYAVERRHAMENLPVLDTPDKEQKASFARALIAVVSRDGPISMTVAWERAELESGFRISQDHYHNIIVTARKMLKGTGHQFRVDNREQAFFLRRLEGTSTHRHANRGEGSKLTIKGDASITLSPGSVLQFDHAEISGQTEDGGEVRLKLRNLAVKLLTTFAILAIVVTLIFTVA